MKPILVVGEINADLIFGGCPRMPEPDTELLASSFERTSGSSNMLCALGLARLGEKVLFRGLAGADDAGRFCRSLLQARGIDTQAIELRADLQTGLTVSISTSTDRALLTYPGAMTALKAEDVSDALLARAGHLHVSSFFLQTGLRPGLAGLMQRAHAAGLTTSLDTGFDPAQQWGDPAEWARLLQHVDVFMPNEREACAIAQAARADQALAALTALGNGATLVVVKCGSRGAVAKDVDGRRLEVAAHALQAVRDTTGAGDAFDAGFLYAWRQRWPLAQALAWGNACGGLSTRCLGGMDGQATVAEVHAHLEQAG